LFFSFFSNGDSGDCKNEEKVGAQEKDGKSKMGKIKFWKKLENLGKLKIGKFLFWKILEKL